MNQSDRLFRWAFNVFIFLMCANLGMVIALKSIYFQAEKRMKEDAAKVDFVCGDYDNSDSFWPVNNSERKLSENCEGKHCPQSLWYKTQEQDQDLQVVAVQKPRPSQVIDGKLTPGHYVNLDLLLTDRPLTLVLVSQKMLQWNLNVIEPDQTMIEQTPVSDLDFFSSLLITPEFHIAAADMEKKAQDLLKEVIVVGPELVWLEGLPENTKVTYFNNDQICAYPTAWEESKNPGNEFRRLFKALNTYTGLAVTHFQGKKVGRYMRTPYDGPQVEVDTQSTRSISSKEVSQAKELGMSWQRQGKSLIASKLKYRNKGELQQVELPQGTQHALFDEGSDKLFVIRHHQFGTWNDQTKKFEALHVPLNMPAMYWPSAMTFNPLRSEIFIYNDDRGGELFVYNVVNKTWRKLAGRFGYSLISLYFDSEKESLFGSRYQGQKIHEVVEYDAQGNLKTRTSLDQPLDFMKTHWHAQIVSGNDKLFLKVIHPADPEGEMHAIGTSSSKL